MCKKISSLSCWSARTPPKLGVLRPKHMISERSRLEAKYRSAMADFDWELGAQNPFEIEMRRIEGPSSHPPATLAAPLSPLADFFITTFR